MLTAWYQDVRRLRSLNPFFLAGRIAIYVRNRDTDSDLAYEPDSEDLFNLDDVNLALDELEVSTNIDPLPKKD